MTDRWGFKPTLAEAEKWDGGGPIGHEAVGSGVNSTADGEPVSRASKYSKKHLIVGATKGV
eukprot:12882426-Prorocentrum_lima.AAC.1